MCVWSVTKFRECASFVGKETRCSGDIKNDGRDSDKFEKGDACLGRALRWFFSPSSCSSSNSVSPARPPPTRSLAVSLSHYLVTIFLVDSFIYFMSLCCRA